jgi:hypothetical protein
MRILFIAAAAVILLSCTTVSKLEQDRVQTMIMSRGVLSQAKLTAFLLAKNSSLDKKETGKIVRLYIQEAAAEGVNHDIALAQLCLETGYLGFKGQVSREQNNFCGLGVVNSTVSGLSFPDERTGVRAHIQHLKAYASEEALKRELVDPRFKWVKRGSAPDIYSLTGRWATDPAYGEKLYSILQRMMSF